ncbi:MAG: tail fiber protein [Gallionella sp.]|nr:tail fiber protein [Gallionella sp.]MDD4958639.1 tail fiber protein [Gallionella sp.]
MSDPYIGEIRAFGFNYVPQGWALCNGQQLAVNQYTALYSVIGNRYGGNQTTFALPNLMGRSVMGQGQGNGLTPRQVGNQTGSNAVALDATQLPAHTHPVDGTSSTTAPLAQATANQSWIARELSATIYAESPNTVLASPTFGVAGSGAAHENRQPCLALNFCICLDGNYPVRP